MIPVACNMNHDLQRMNVSNIAGSGGMFSSSDSHTALAAAAAVPTAAGDPQLTAGSASDAALAANAAANPSSDDEYDLANLSIPGSRSAASSVSNFSTRNTHTAGEGTDGMNGESESGADDRASLCSSKLAALALAGSASHAPQLSPIQEDDMQAFSQAAPRVPGRERDLHMKLLLLGESGLGKTTLMHQLLRSYSEGGGAIEQGHDGSSSSMEQFKRNPQSLCTELQPVVIPDKNLRLLLKIQDMPGWGDDINLRRYLETVMTFIMEQRAADHAELHGHMSLPKEYVAGCLKHSVTACLYFLPPHRIKQVDLILMSALSQQVILIPVIAKADTMTVEETVKYRQEILERCLNPNSFVNRSTTGMPELKMDFFSFDIDDLQALNVAPVVPPFTIITSEQFDAEGRPVRQNLWGVCNAADHNHSDFILLKRLLLGDKVNSLWQLLDDSYKRYVSFCDDYEAGGEQLGPVVDAACAACGPHLEYDDNFKPQSQVKQLQKDKQQLQEELAAAHSASRRASYVAAGAVLLLLLVTALAVGTCLHVFWSLQQALHSVAHRCWR